MANENMIKFLRGNVANLPQTATPGALYFTKDEGIYMGMEDGSYHRYGDFIIVANIDSLPASGANATCMYYCSEQNVLCRYDSVNSKWIQINKQPTAEEMKTLLGLGSLAYLSEVGEDNLSSALREKVNAASEGNHSHNNKALLDTYTQTEENLADAVAKKHSHTFNETELNKIVEGDVAKWNAAEGNAKAYVDEKIAGLDYADTAVDGEYVSAVNEVDGKISVTRKALPDYSNVYEAKGEAAKVQGELNTYKETNDIALANVKATAEAAYVKPVTGIAKDDLSAEVKASLGKADTALQSHQDISHLAVKSDVETELGKKVDKTVYEGKVSELEGAINGKVAIETGKSLVLDTEITKLAGVSEGANKVESSTVNGKIKIDGVETVVYTHPEKHTIAEVDGLQTALDGKQAAGNYSEVGHKHVKADITDFAHTHTKSEITDFAHTHVASEITDLDATIKGYDYATKTELGNVDKKFENYKTAEAQKAIDDEQDRRLGVIEGDYLKAADIAEFETKTNVKKVADDLAGYVESNNAAVALKADKSVVEAMYTNGQIDGFLGGKVDKTTYEEEKATFALKSEITSLADKADKSYVDEELAKKVNVSDYNNDKATFATKTELNGVSERVSVVEGILNDAGEGEELTKGLVSRVADLEAIDHDKLAADASAAAVATVLDGAPEKFDTLKEIAAWIADADTAEDAASLVTRVSALEGIDHEAYVGADAALKGELEGKINAINNHSHSFVESELNEIKAGDVALWNAEKGAKELAASKTTTAEVKTQIEAYGYATEADLTLAEGRLDVLEAIDHEAYIAADATLKSELEGKIAEAKTAAANQDAVVLSESQKYTDAAKAEAIADAEGKVNALAGNVYTKAQTYTQEEVNTLLSNAMSWGEF